MQIVRIPVVVCLLAFVIVWTPLVAAPLSAAQQTAIEAVVHREMERLRIPACRSPSRGMARPSTRGPSAWPTSRTR